MTSSSRPASPAAGHNADATDWVHVIASARHQRSIYLAGLLRSALAALTPGAHRAR